MADATNPKTPINEGELAAVQREMDGLIVDIELLTNKMEKYGQVSGQVAKHAVEDLSVQREALKRQLEASGEYAKSIQNGTATTQQSTQALGEQKKQLGVVGVLMSNLGAVGENVLGKMMDRFNGVKDTLGAALPTAGAKLKQSLLNAFDVKSFGLLSMQKEALAFQKIILQTGGSFGQAFEGAHANIKNFTDRWADTVNTVKATPAEIDQVNQAFKDTMPIQEQVRSLTGLQDAHSGLTSTITATNVALLAHAATGVDATKAAGWMGTAVTELGASSEEAALNLARINYATKNSGLSFDKVGSSIMSAAGQLKMWGGTVASVTPMYKAFSDSLAGTGRQGLTPELLQRYIGGLEQMQFSSRALLGIQMPGGAAKGAIGAGLEMEEALEDTTGAGMTKITEGLTNMLTKFGNEQIVTRKEAIADPALQRNFMVQRQLLGQQMHMDDATATRTLEMLKNINRTGLNTGGDMKTKLNHLLKSGEKTNESTQDALTQAQNETTEATRTGAESIVAAVKEVAGPTIMALLNQVGKTGTSLVSRTPTTSRDLNVIERSLGQPIQRPGETTAAHGLSKTEVDERNARLSQEASKLASTKPGEKTLELIAALKSAGLTNASSKEQAAFVSQTKGGTPEQINKLINDLSTQKQVIIPNTMPPRAPVTESTAASMAAKQGTALMNGTIQQKVQLIPEISNVNLKGRKVSFDVDLTLNKEQFQQAYIEMRNKSLQ